MRAKRRDDGFTMLEMIITLALGSILMTIATWGMHSFLVSQRQSQTAVSVRSALRNAAEQSVSEGRTYCVYFTSTTWTVYKSACPPDGAAVKSTGPYRVSDASITLTDVTFTAPLTPVPNQKTTCPASGACAYFYPRGNALTGTLIVRRSSKTYTITVQGLTGRVSMG